MAIGDISLTASMRSNLFSLQQTASLLGRTQERLSTGKRVNSALDDPTSFFTAKAHLSDAANLDSLKNGMSEAVQTVKAADTGVTTINGLIASAKALANTAKATADAGSASGKDVTIAFNDTTAPAADTKVTVNGMDFTGRANLAAIVGDGSTEFVITAAGAGAGAANADALAALINGVREKTGPTDVDFVATSSNGTVTITKADGSAIAGTDVTTTIGATAATKTLATSSSGRMALADQFDSIMTQINNVVADAGYNGVNLLQATSTLTVDFGNSHTLSVSGFDGTGGLSATTANGLWADSATIDGDITKLDNATSALKVGSQNLSNNLSIVTARQDWTKNSINVLQTGADNLTLADMNEEGANMLMLQTRQSLGTTSLSLASQAAQSVLRLFG